LISIDYRPTHLFSATITEPPSRKGSSSLLARGSQLREDNQLAAEVYGREDHRWQKFTAGKTVGG